MMSLSFDQGTSEVAYSFNDETSALYWSLPPEFHGNKVCILYIVALKEIYSPIKVQLIFRQVFIDDLFTVYVYLQDYQTFRIRHNNLPNKSSALKSVNSNFTLAHRNSYRPRLTFCLITMYLI